METLCDLIYHGDPIAIALLISLGIMATLIHSNTGRSRRD